MMFVDFEGIDGSGKTTLSNRVAARLKTLGHPVCHARAGGALASPIAERIRSLTRDTHHVSLSESAELLLYAAREAQTTEEIVRPALTRGDWVITDRYIFSHLVLARDGRGMDHPALWKVLEFASGGLMPQLVIFVDVEPSIARARKRCGKIRDGKFNDSSRKGQAGAGLSYRLRQGFHALARANPETWIVFDNTWASLDEAEEFLVNAIVERASGKPLPSLSLGRAPSGLPIASNLRNESELRDSLLATIDAIAEREPPLAAHLLRGLAGTEIDERRLRLAVYAPGVVANGLRGLFSEGTITLRHVLKAIEPGQVAQSLLGLWDEASFSLRKELLDRVPQYVARSLECVADERAMELRGRLAALAPGDVLVGLGGVDNPEAWRFREQLMEKANADELALSLKGLSSEIACQMREKLEASAPLAVVESLTGLRDARAYDTRTRFMRRAPRAVLETLVGIDDEESWRLRESVGERMREAVESAVGLDSERAWALRERLADIWPAACVHSLQGVARGPRGQALLFGILNRWSEILEVLHRAVWVLDPAWDRARHASDVLFRKAV